MLRPQVEIKATQVISTRICASLGIAEELAFAIPARSFDTIELVLNAAGELQPLRPVPSALALLETQKLLGSCQLAAVHQATLTRALTRTRTRTRTLTKP